MGVSALNSFVQDSNRLSSINKSCFWIFRFSAILLAVLSVLSGCEMFSRADYSDYLERVNGLYTYSLTYNSNNSGYHGYVEGEVPVDSGIYLEGKAAVVKDQNDLIKPYFTFSGWSLTLGGPVDYLPGDSFQFPGNSITLYAVWSEDNYTLSYDGNGNTGGVVPSSQSSIHATSVTVSADVLSRSSYYFIGWNTEADGSGTFYGSGDEINLTGDLTLYAYWSAIPGYAVTYNGNGSTGGSTPSTHIKYENTDLNIKTGDSLIRTNYSFTGWNTSPDGSGNDYTPGFVYTDNAPLTLYAMWQITIFGSGTAVDPYQIGMAEQLVMVGTEPFGLDDHYIQTDNIDLAGIEFVPIGDPYNKFTGNFDGNDFEIRNLTISSFGGNYLGLFGYASGGAGENVIQSVHLTDYNITVNSENPRYMGSLIGFSGGGTDVRFCSAEGTIFITKMHSVDTSYVGGLIGYISSTQAVSECYSKGDIVLGSGAGSGELTLYVGGLIGQNEAPIFNCYSTVSITDFSIQPWSNYFSGGLLGRSRLSSNSNNYATGSISMNGTGGALGGIIGYVSSDNISGSIAFNDSLSDGSRITQFSPVINSCYANEYMLINGSVPGDLDISPSSTAGENLTQVNFSNMGYMTGVLGWDSSIWEVKDGAVRPTLKNNSGGDDGQTMQ